MWSPDISTAPPRASGLRASRSTTRVTNRRRIHAGGLPAVGRQLGRRGSAARSHATRVRAAGESASYPTRRQVFPDRSDSPLRTLAAADTADLSGRRVFLRGKILAPFGVYPL